MLSAEFAILVHLKAIGIVFLVLDRIVIPLLAFGACHRNFHSHGLILFRYCIRKPESIRSTLRFFGAFLGIPFGVHRFSQRTLR
jgi:hypothetical protein